MTHMPGTHFRDEYVFKRFEYMLRLKDYKKVTISTLVIRCALWHNDRHQMRTMDHKSTHPAVI